jgi:transcriptional antiterminator NusG
MQSQWFVIHTLSGQEQKVKDSIEKRLKAEEMGEFIKEVMVPMEKVAEVRGGKKTVTSRKLHPGYVYIDMALLDEGRRVLDRPWYFIRETPGIIGLSGANAPSSHPGRNRRHQGDCLRVGGHRPKVISSGRDH